MKNNVLQKVLPAFIMAILFFMNAESFAQQNVGIGITTPDASAILDLTATDKGMLVPRMTSVQRTAIAAPAAGLLVYDTDFSQFWFFDGTIWNPIAAGAVGPTGPTGDPGTAGAVGPAGPTGDPGTPGAVGAVGPAGANGVNGVTGPTGDPGTPGAVGAVGPVGPIGPAGANGVNGVTGPTGDPGTPGAVGPVGPAGAVGPIGLTGTTGAIGLTGPTGPVGCAVANYVMKSNGTNGVCSQIFDNGTNVGVGTAAPSQKLDVVGAVQFSSAIMPAGDAGIVGKVLQSNGPGVPPTWVGAVMPSQVYSCESTSALSVTTATFTVIPGETLTINGLATGDRIMLWASGNALMTTVNYCNMDVAMFVNGVMLDVGGFVRFSLDYDVAWISWQNYSSIARYTIPAAGSYTFDVRARRASGTGTISIGGNSTEATEGVFMIFVLKN